MTTYPYSVALPESYALKYARREVNRDADRLGARTVRSMAKKAGGYFCVFSFTTERHESAFVRQAGRRRRLGANRCEVKRHDGFEMEAHCFRWRNLPR
ncbi:hypothetical protein KUG47_06285 [Falsochrobactrum sp. TDYN1]|uniref:Uncharacterized protein n=1 Tax=Falsochrobactrum tianjinense TaxID=2706015 RepID=A0A949PM18_9HYPH|nr:hypothetical protein [Falsochrobactrum sp. TDYN1]MBV2143102.1 hypothetical protein [Falsochrobactrum sp. TDYN1]